MELPKKYNPKDIEDKIYRFWLEGNCFSAKASHEKEPFCIVIPPPNITGILHMGHALNNTIQDVLIRFKRMSGFESLWMPGTDHAGIATQNVVERDLSKEKLRKEDIGREEFLKRLWNWKEEYGSTIIEQLKKIGASCDWSRMRFTMDEEYSDAVKEVFIKLYNKGWIYRGKYIINWCPRCKTALSDEEAAHKEIDGWLYYIKYPIKKQKEKYIIVATTRPETMLGDTAIAINPEDNRYQWLKGKRVILPVVERELRVIEDDIVDPDFGTGVVKVTPAHDPTDHMLGKKYNLDFINIMNDDATLNENVPDDFIGMDRFEAREALLDVLREKNLIEKEKPYNISAGHCYRCHTIIEPRESSQWFVEMKPLARKTIDVVRQDEIKFYPQRWKKVYLNWMENIQDWCISRQIWWGHRIPVYYCNNCKPLQTKGEIVDWKGSGIPKKKGVIVSKIKPEKCPDCDSTDIVQEKDVLDTWFSSWLWPFATFYWPFKQLSDAGYQQSAEERLEAKSKKHKAELEYFYPTSVLVTASEILFFWVARMIMSGLEFMDKIPFDDVMIHGTVRDEKGVKMSKSLGNTIDPLEIVDKFGADALRFSLMLLASTGSDVYLSSEKFLVGRNFANKIWNASRFILNKIDETNTKPSNLKLENLDDIDKWVLDALNNTIKEVNASLENYRISDATKKIYDFFWHILCDWYIEITKAYFNETKAKVLILCLVNSMKLLHPIMPFITEEIYQILKKYYSFLGEKSVMESEWPKGFESALEKESIELIDSLISLVKEIRNLKIDLGISPSKKLNTLLRANEKIKDKINVHREWIIRLSNLEDIEFKENLDRIIFDTDYLELDFVLKEFDHKSYLESLEKKIKKISTLLDRASQKINNEKFIKNAPRETIEKEREKFESMSIQRKRLHRLKYVFG